jgi:hypothetical protein
MIRDPSDGTVREPKPGSSGAMPGSEPGKTGSALETGTSGLPTDKIDAKRAAQLEKSREWLKNYFHRKT